MYTNSIEKEKEFLLSILERFHTNRGDGETALICKCPKCHIGSVICRCTHDIANGKIQSWKFDVYCDNCGEIFDPGTIRSDIFFNKPHKVIDELETPFGSIKVWINGKIVPFRYRIKTYDDPEEDALAPTVTMHIIDIDLSQLKVGDEIFCGFDKDLLEYNDGDERSLLYSCENEEQIMGLCAYDPYEWDLDDCCFQLKECTSKGFGYCIVSDPNQFDEKKNYQSKITSLAAAWLTKKEYNDADLVMNLALTCVIG